MRTAVEMAAARYGRRLEVGPSRHHSTFSRGGDLAPNFCGALARQGMCSRLVWARPRSHQHCRNSSPPCPYGKMMAGCHETSDCEDKEEEEEEEEERGEGRRRRRRGQSCRP
ncbi:unnamed protein product [Prorocentrum cordatum]|uniref:Uncharacterized protein n=1 Tax=Prorocentrum cordatum TaxID=2364126 RepID=A0ABN9Q3C1_9DINO|nr:unnamed protein product [Polarella glacialis]